MESQLAGAHQKVYERIFQHPIPHNLQWRELCSMFEGMPMRKLSRIKKEIWKSRETAKR